MILHYVGLYLALRVLQCLPKPDFSRHSYHSGLCRVGVVVQGAKFTPCGAWDFRNAEEQSLLTVSVRQMQFHFLYILLFAALAKG